MCDTRTLCSRENILISHCIGCKYVYLWHNNLVINLTTEQFHSFSKLISEYNFDDGALPFPDESERIMVRMPDRDISMAFTRGEWQDLREILSEANYMLQVYEMLG